MSYQAGDTYPWSVKVRDGDGNLVDPELLTVSVREPDTTITEYVYGIDALVVRDSEGIFHADIPLTDAGMWIIQGATTNEPEVARVQIAVGPALEAAVTFCTPADIATRLARDLTTAEASTVEMLCELVTTEIAAAADKAADWPASLTEIHPTLRTIAVEVVARTMRNPDGFSSTSETLGAYTYTQRYGDEGIGGGHVGDLALTAAERRRVRRAVFGVGVASVPLVSIFDVELPLP
jgi:hypothetical protein